ncbi:MAG: SCP2 sterol-binding domain-containing protein [Acidimicrobiia bacterium]
MAPVELFGEAWCAAASALGPVTFDARPTGFSVQVIVTGSPSGDTRLVATVDDAGGLSVGPADGGPAPDLVVTVPRAEAAALLAGRLRLDTAYMQGRVKVAGDHALVLRVLAASAGQGWAAGLARLAAVTAFPEPV